MQYSFKPFIGRIGMSLDIYAIQKDGLIDHTYNIVVNGKGFQIKRRPESDPSLVTDVCEFDSFLYPDRIEHEEVQMARMIMGSSTQRDEDVMYLASVLCAKYAAGHDEESLMDAIRSTLQYWMDDQL